MAQRRRGRPPNPLDPDASRAARLGAEIRARRQAQGLTLEALATLIGFSPQHVSEAELAKAPVSEPFVAACDRALDAQGALLALLPAVVYERATERHDRSVARRRSRRSGMAYEPRELASARAAATTEEETRVMAELRHAVLCRYGHAEEDDEEHGDPTLQSEVVACWQLRQQGRYVQLGALLAELFDRLDLAVRRRDDDGSALQLLVHAYNAASSVCKTLGDPGLAVVCADRAVQVGRAADDPLLVAAGAYRLANMYLIAGDVREGHDVALSGAGVLEPTAGASRARLATWGGLMLTAAVARARQQDERGAWELIGEAEDAAGRLGSEHVGLHTIFGPTSVIIYAVEVAAELGDGRDAVKRARGIDLGRLPGGLLERRSHFLVEVARGHSQQANARSALAALLWAERLTPDEVRLNPKARNLVEHLVVRAPSGAASELNELATRMRVAV
jgi:transcriptional regulator with XRE-family HTH domain